MQPLCLTCVRYACGDTGLPSAFAAVGVVDGFRQDISRLTEIVDTTP